jgi:hypothetical protein
LLKYQALAYYDNHLRRSLESEDSEIPDNDFIELVLRELYIGLEYIPKRAIRVQKYYIRLVTFSLSEFNHKKQT